MSTFLKGNYTVKSSKAASKARAPRKKPAKAQQEFEQRALEKLGGSIAFIAKSSFVWNGENGEESGKGSN